jgi:hypothetical protein
MKQLEFKPEVDFEQYGKLPFKESLSVNLFKRNSTTHDVISNAKKESEIQESKTMGIETGMVYIAVPVSIAVWSAIIYFIKVTFF